MCTNAGFDQSGISEVGEGFGMSTNELRSPAFVMKQVSKVYPGTIAVDKVDFEVFPGEVHALVGENGAGKSTLMKMMAGSFDDYTGTIIVNGNDVELHSPAQAKKHGIEMIYQELSLALPISIAENILVGRLPKKGIFIDRDKMNIETRECLEKVGLEHIDPVTPVEDISQHEAQLAEIAKALGNDPAILVMDEPTSALSREEVERLFEIIGRLKGLWLAIVYISHHLPEIFKVADRVTVLRDGKLIDTRNISDINREEIVQMMVGRSVTEFYKHESHAGESVRLKVENLTRKGFFHDISFQAYQGEVVGICGLSGAGRSELARVLVGLDKRDSGTTFIDGKEVNPGTMAQALRDGITYLTENRKTEGLATRLDVQDNILAGLVPQLSRNGIYDKKKGVPVMERLIKELAIYPQDPYRTVANLSGGNQQKVLLAKWAACNPKVLILDEPTRGVDVGAKLIIHKAIEALTEEGQTIILISSDLPELVSLSNRVMIMHQGHFIREMSKEECTEESVLLAANGEEASI
jgi:ABC-type sugar transport system ATPase subunit